jgi:hypothetical protein
MDVTQAEQSAITKLFGTSIAGPSWGIPSFNAARESSIEDFGTLPFFFSVLSARLRN